MFPRSRTARAGAIAAIAVAILLVAGVVVAVVSRGGADGGPAVRSVQRYDRLIGDGNAAGACASLAPRARALIARAAAPLGRPSCTQVMRALLAKLGPDGRASVAHASVHTAWKKRDVVRVKVDFGGGRQPADLLVLRSGRRWLVGPPLRAASR